MPDLVPIFPLQLVVFPGEQLNLHIFEPRYRQLIRECEEADQFFVIPPFIDGKIMRIGTEVRLTEISRRYDNGEMDIKVAGSGLLTIGSIANPVPGKLYSGASATPFEVNTEENPETGARIMKLLHVLYYILKIDKDLPDVNHPSLSYALGHLIGLSLEKEYELLNIRNGFERQKYILKHLDKMIPQAKEMEEMKHRAELNGHFRYIDPPKF
jgi:Lon protease-like protein